MRMMLQQCRNLQGLTIFELVISIRLRIFFLVFSSFVAISTYSQSGNFTYSGCSRIINYYHRRQELITGTPSFLLQNTYFQQFQKVNILIPLPSNVFRGKFSGNNYSQHFLPLL